MQSLKRIVLFVIIATGFIVPLCIAQTEKVLSGRDLLKAMRGEDMPSASELIDKYTKALDSTQSFIASNETVCDFNSYVPGHSGWFYGKRYGLMVLISFQSIYLF